MTRQTPATPPPSTSRLRSSLHAERQQALVTGSGPLLIVTSYASATDPKLVEGLRQKGIEKFIAFELPLDMVRQRYGGHFSVVEQGSSESIRILDLDGRRAFHLFRFQEFGPAVFHDGSLGHH